MAFIYDLSDTWNNAGISFNGIKLNATDTASAAGSKLLDLQISGVSKFTVGKTGTVTATGIIESTSGGFRFPDGTTQITRGLSSITSVDGSITVSGTTTVDLSVATAGYTSNVLLPIRNTTGATLTKGTAVYISGATGQISTVTKAIANSDPTSAQTLGLVAADIANNANGNVTLIGTITNINTSAYTDGQQLYLSPTTAGTLTATKPYAPNHLVYMAVVEHAHPSQGKLFVKVQNGYEMDELHDVAAQSPSNGQTLVYNSTTGLWEKNTVSLTAGVNGTLPIANGGTGATTLTSGYLVKGNGTSAASASVIYDSGTNVGIGTASPSNKLAISDSVNGFEFAPGTTSILQTVSRPGGAYLDFNLKIRDFIVTANNAEAMRVTNGGFVGIGTSSPSSLFMIRGGAATATISSTTNTSNIDLINSTQTTRLGAINTDFAIMHNGSERMRVTATGNVGIGTTTPAQKLSVAGNIESTTGGVIVPDQLAYDYAASNLPTIRPTLSLDFVDVGALDPRITFTRGSTATYYDGRTQAVAEQNLLLWSQDFDNGTWSKGNTAATANAITAPDGTLTADKVETTTNAPTGGGQTYQTLTNLGSGNYIYSIYAKQGSGAIESNIFGIRNNTTSTNAAIIGFDYGSGVITQASGSGATAVSVGNGWWRIVMPFTLTATVGDAIRFYAGSSGGVEPVGEFAYFWGAQLEQRSTATAYTPTTTAPITRYQPVLVTAPVNAPRFDYDPVTLAPKGFMVEETRTNLMRYSDQFDNAVWTNASPNIPIVTLNTSVAPDGTTTADTLTSATGGTAAQTRQNVSSTGATGNFTGSIYLKAGTSTQSRIQLSDTTSGFNVVGDFRISWTGGVAAVQSVTSGTASVIAFGNGWYRCIITANIPSANASVALALVPDSLVGTNSVIAWGAQLELGSYATSYIPTVASTVTRSADNPSMTGTNFSSWYRQDEGTFIIEMSQVAVGEFSRFLEATELTFTTRKPLLLMNSSNQYVMQFRDNGVDQASPVVGVMSANTVMRLSASYKVNDFAGTLNGATPVTDTSGVVTAPVDRLFIGYGGSAPGDQISCHIRSLTYYPTRLPNAVLQGMTS